MYWTFYVAILFWLSVVFCIAAGLMIRKDHDPEACEAREFLGEMGWIGSGIIGVVDIIWVLMMTHRIAPAWQDAQVDWSWVDQNITIPWIAPQIVIVIGACIYILVFGKKSKPEK